MHEKNSAHQQQRERLHIFDRFFAKVFHVHAASGIRLGLISSDSRCDRLHFSPHLFDRNTPFHLDEAVEIKMSARIFFLRNLQRHP